MPSSSIVPLLLLLMYNSSRIVHAKTVESVSDNYAQLTRRSRKSQQQRALQSTSSSSLCSCSPTIFNIQINIHSDPCKTDELEDNSGVKGTLCLVGQTESGDVDSGTHGEESNGGISDGGSGMEVQSPSPTTSTISSSGSTTSSPVSSSTATETSKLPTFSPTINPTFQTSTAASTTNTQDPFMPPAGAMPVPRPSESLPTYAPSTPIPTYGTYSPTYSTYEPTNTADGESRADFIEPVKGAISIPSKKTTTYYPTVDDTYSPTDRVGHDVASLIQRVKRMNRPSGSYNTYAPSTPFPTFDTYSPTQNNDGKVTEEPKRRLLEVINLDELDQFDASQNAVEPGITEAQKPKVSDAVNAWISIPPNDEFFTRFPEWKRHQEEIYRLRHDASVIQQTSTLRKDVIEQPPRMLQSSIAVPTQLISAQFLEIDTSPDMTIINQDDSYLNLTDFYEKDITLSYTSVSATLDPNMSLEDQIDDVPGGAILVLIGQDENGELVRNRLMWTYTMKCGLSTKTVEDGDEFGWAIFDDLEPAREEFCPASSATTAPSPSPTGFSMDYNAMDYNRLLRHFDLEGDDSSKMKSRKTSEGRRISSGRTTKNEAKKKEVNQDKPVGQDNRVAAEEFGRMLKDKPDILDTSLNKAKEPGAMKRLRKRIAV